MSREIKELTPRDVTPWTPIPELARWERAMERMFGKMPEKKPAGEKKKPFGDWPTARDRGCA
jgi:hypothetical protein